MALAAGLMLLFPVSIVGFFSDEAAVLDYAVRCLRILAYGYVFWAVFVSDVLAGIVGVAVFKRGRWKTRQV